MEQNDERDRYLMRLNTLYSEIEGWLRDSGLRFDRRLKSMADATGEQYHAPILVISGAGGEEIACIAPYSYDVVGAEGLVSVVGSYDTRMLSYFLDNGPPLGGRVAEPAMEYLLSGVEKPGWYVIADPKTGVTRRLDADLLYELLAEVSDYGV